MKLSKKQTQAIDILEDKTTNVLLYGGGAGGGKSMLGVYWILKSALKYRKTRWVIGRSRLKTLKETTLQSFFEVCNMQGLKAQVDYTYNETKSLITLHYSESEVLLKDLFRMPSDPHFDGLGSLEISGCFIDECAEITPIAYNILQSRIRYRLDEHNIIPKVLMTCNPSVGWIYTQFYKKHKSKTLPANQKFIQSLVTDNPNISKHYIEQLKQTDMLTQRRLLYGDWEFSDDATRLFHVDSLNDMFTNDFVMKGQKFMSVDVARFGRDQSVVCVWNGFRCEQIFTWDKNTLTELADNVQRIANDNMVSRSNIIVDSDGVGGAIPDILKGVKSFINNSRALKGENYKNLKSQCYYKFAERVKKGEVFINCVDPVMKQNIITEFEICKQYDIDKENKLSITPKDQIKSMLGRSPDLSDAIIMREFFELRKSQIVFFK
jgi:ribosomal protein S8